MDQSLNVFQTSSMAVQRCRVLFIFHIHTNFGKCSPYKHISNLARYTWHTPYKIKRSHACHTV